MLSFFANPQEVIKELVLGNYAKESSYKARELFTLEEHFFQQVKEDVLRLLQNESSSNVAQKNHATYWAGPGGKAIQFSLLNSSGRFDDYSVDHIKSVKGKKFHHAKKYPALAKFIRMFPDAINFRANLFGANSALNQHREDITIPHKKNKNALRVRFHLPIQTNDQVQMFVGGNYYHFEEGKLYFFHNGCVHAAFNRHPTEDRVHLVWDMLLTKDTYERMFSGESPAEALFSSGNIPVEPIGYGEITRHPSKRGKITLKEALEITLCTRQ